MKRGQDASGAAAVIGALTILFIFYIVFLPPETRMELLEGKAPDTNETIKSGVLYSDSIGKLAPAGKTTFDHYIPNIYLAETKNAQVLSRANPFTVRKGWFGEDRKEITFMIPEYENTENTILSFQTLSRNGVLHIVVNGVPIFEGKIAGQNPPPITLPKDMLLQSNTIEFYVTGGFFGKKEYSISNMQIIGDVLDPRKQRAENTFKITQLEYDHLENSWLDFYPICDQADVGILTISLNGRNIYSAVPACESANRQEIFKEDLRVGRNALNFDVNQGDYRVEQIRVRNKVKPITSFIDFFNVNDDLYSDIISNDVDLVLKIELVDDGTTKQAEVNINGRLDAINQKKEKYERDISGIIKEGNNYIEIKPITEINIADIEIRAE